MEITDLMIGDLVSFNGKAKRINIIDTWYNEVSYFDSDAEGVLSFRLDDIEPIPLTVEILKNNGFYVYNRDDYSDAKLDIYVDEDNLYQISLNRKGDNYRIAIHYIKWFDHKTGKYDSHCLYSNGLFSDFKPLYVHELQNAMRLCGLTELSNNFKI